MRVNQHKIPEMLRGLNQWVLWRNLDGTKKPFSPHGGMAKANDPSTWGTFDQAVEMYGAGGFDGIGFEFAENGDLVGIDLDSCRDPESGKIDDWATGLIRELDTYAEVSPSEGGVKMIARGRLPFDSGRKKTLGKANERKAPAIEIYDRVRYFAITGWRLAGQREPQSRQAEIETLCALYFPPESSSTVGWSSPTTLQERARKYHAKLEGAVSGQSGHSATYHAACVLVLDFGLSVDDAWPIMLEYNQRCQPPWNERDLRRKLTEANKEPGPRGKLRDAKPDNWDKIKIPKRETPKLTSEPRITTIREATSAYVQELAKGLVPLVSCGVSEVDYALGGGFAFGEYGILGGRPSHGKSTVGAQFAHEWTLAGLPTLIIAEEMSARTYGQRTLQFASDIPQEHWPHSISTLTRQVDDFTIERAECFIAESCGTAAAAVEQIERHVEQHDVKCVIVDYLQLLRSPGRSRFEQVTETSIALRQVTNKHKLITLGLCQLNRSLDSRQDFIPKMSDLKESGQLEQDADVILFVVWPHRIDKTCPPNQLSLFIAKNRNRAINAYSVDLHFSPSRQMVTEQGIDRGRVYRNQDAPDHQDHEQQTEFFK